MSLVPEERNFQQVQKLVLQLLDKKEYKTGISLPQVQKFLDGKAGRLSGGPEVKMIVEKLIKCGSLVDGGKGKFLLNEGTSCGARTAPCSQRRRSQSRRSQRSRSRRSSGSGRRSRSRRRQNDSTSGQAASRRSRRNRSRMVGHTAGRRGNRRQRSSGSSSPESTERRRRSRSRS